MTGASPAVGSWVECGGWGLALGRAVPVPLPRCRPWPGHVASKASVSSAV